MDVYTDKQSGLQIVEFIYSIRLLVSVHGGQLRISGFTYNV